MHLLIGMPRDLSVSEMMRQVKANSSKWVHEEFPALSTFAWQTGYGAFSVSYSATGAVRAYIEGQEQHHRRQSFQDEFSAFLRKHGIPVDERHMWD
jgi:REP element-mobilizing transposase RayT